MPNLETAAEGMGKKRSDGGMGGRIGADLSCGFTPL